MLSIKPMRGLQAGEADVGNQVRNQHRHIQRDIPRRGGMVSRFAAGLQIAQNRPAGTSAISVYTAALRTEVTTIAICNTTASAARFSLYHDDDGSTFDATTALNFDQEIAGKSTVYIQSESVGTGVIVAIGGQIGVQTDTANALTFSVYGGIEYRDPS